MPLFMVPSLAPPTGPPEKPFFLVLPSDDLTVKPYRVRVERDYGSGLIEIVDEAMTSRSPQAQPTGRNGGVLLTIEEARWVRAALNELLDDDGPDPDSGDCNVKGHVLHRQFGEPDFLGECEKCRLSNVVAGDRGAGDTQEGS